MFKSLIAFLLAVAALIGSTTLPPDVENPDATEPTETTAPVEPTEPEEPHSHNFIREVVAPTCLEGGYTVYSCSCGEMYRGEYTDISDHSYSDWIVVVEATCINTGTEKRICNICGDEDVRYVSTNFHPYEDAVTHPTCTSQGYTEHICKYCGYTYKDKHTDKTGHIYSQWVPVNESTCIEGGQEIRTCTACGDTEVRHVSAQGHQYEATVTRPTCTSKGYTTYTCKCGDQYIADFVQELPHRYSTTEIKPSCIEAGYTIYTCECGLQHTGEYTDPTGHSFTNYIFNNDATCTNPGTKTAKCDHCNATDTVKCENNSAKHNYNKRIVNPTCTAGGYTVYTCSCGDSYKADYTDALGHSFADYKPNNDATCTSPGTKTAKCDRCTATNTIIDTESAYGHKYVESVTPATCTDPGYTRYVCKCGKTYNDKHTQPLGHKYTQYKSNGDATCTEDGTKTAKCDRCDFKVTVKDTGSATGHQYTKKVKDATCTAKGYTTYTCECGDTYKGDYKDPLGHSFTKYVSNNNATCTKDGTKTAKCNRCSATDTVTDKGSAKGHTYTERVTAPTCTEKGYTTFVCSCGHSYKDKYQNATGHKYTATKTEPTCTQKGYTTHKCKCGASYVDSYVAAKGHTWGRWIVMESATYDKEGREERMCRICKATEDRSIPKKERPISNANADEISALAVQYINELRKQEGACAATIMNGCTEYAEYRSMQMAQNGYISHDPDDKKEAANALQYGLYIDPGAYGQSGDPYYTVVGMEAVGTAYGTTVEEVARCIADTVQESKSHWSYVGANSNAFISVGVYLEGDTWYVCIIVARVNLDENPSGV